MMRASFRGLACPQPPTREELASIQAGHPNAANLLLDGWEPIVIESARCRTRCLASRDDIAEAGRLAILASARAFDPNRGAPFNNYASRAVRNETRKAAKRLQSCCQGECSLDLASEVETEALPFDCRDHMRDWLCTLPRILQKIFVTLYRWGLSQRDAAIRMGVSQPRICQLHQMLIARGRRDLAGLMNIESNVDTPMPFGVVA